MFLLNGTLCSNNFRKVGLIQACINLATQILCLAILAKVVIEASPHKRGYYVHGRKINKNLETSVTHILIDIMFFIVIDVVAYLWLIFGLMKKKQSILTGWLMFSVMELIVLQISMFYFAVYITITSHSGASVLGLILPTLVTLYLTYNICVIYTARHGMIQEANGSFRFNERRTLENPSTVSYPPSRIPHTPYLPYSQQSAHCGFQSTTGANTEICVSTGPPPYKESDEC